MADGENFNMTSATRNHTSSSSPEHSPWHSPVPYLFGGLAAMLGLIAFALLILACSYWKLSGYLEAGEDAAAAAAERDLEAGKAEDGEGGEEAKKAKGTQEKFLVIMAGEMKPTHLATRLGNDSSATESTSRSTSFDKSCTCSSSEESEDDDDDGGGEEKEESSDRGRRSRVDHRPTLNQSR